MKSIWNLISTFIIISLVIWYIKGHFGKYFIFFWLNTSISFLIYSDQKSKEMLYERRSGADIWAEKYEGGY